MFKNKLKFIMNMQIYEIKFYSFKNQILIFVNSKPLKTSFHYFL